MRTGERAPRTLSIHAGLQRLSYRGAFRQPARGVLKTVLPGSISEQDRKGLLDLLGWLLAEPRSTCQGILREFLFQRAITAKRWADVMSRRVSPAGVIGDVQLEDEALVGSFLRNQIRGLVLATFHAGDYLSMLLKITSMLPEQRHMYVLRRADARTREANAVLPTLLPNIRVVLADQEGLRQAAQALRRGHVLAVLCDLPPSWGPSVPVCLFGKRLRWTRSAADLARLGKADLLPLTSHLEDSGCCRAAAHGLLSVRTLDAPSVLQQLADTAEATIREQPGQWHQWPLVPAMRDTGDVDGS